MENSAGPKGQRCFFGGANCALSAMEYGDPSLPDLVIVHGMRDHAMAMTTVTAALVDRYHVVVPDLRGHGDSENPGCYTMVQFVADLRALVTHFRLRDVTLIGCSLGGHITAKYAAIYPAEVRALVLVDGMGPPRSTVTTPDDAGRWRQHVASALLVTSDRRAMPDQAAALSRLLDNNPLLAADTAKLIVLHGVEKHPDGGVRWKWDPAVAMVWGTFDQNESEQHYRLVQCPVLVLTGEDSMVYWTRNNIGEALSPDACAAEHERRRQLFQVARHEVIRGAGHMIHYDQPDLLNETVGRFLRRLA